MRKYAVSIVCTLLALSLAVSSFAMSDTDSVYLASADTAAVDVAAGEEQTIPMLLAEEAATYVVITYPRDLSVVYKGVIYRVVMSSPTSYTVRLLSNYGESIVDSATSTAVYNNGIILAAALARDIEGDATTGEMLATALTPYLAETVGGATIEQIQNYFDPQFTILGGKLDQGNSVLQALSDGLTEKIWTTPTGATFMVPHYVNGSYSSVSSDANPLNLLLTATANSTGYGLIKPVNLIGLQWEFLSLEGSTAVGAAPVSRTISPLQAILDQISLAPYQNSNYFVYDGSVLSTIRSSPSYANAYNSRGIVTGITNRFGYGSVTSHTVTDEGIETTDTSYDTIIGALTAATNDTNNLLSGLSYIFASPADIAAKQAVVEDEQVISDSVYGDEGLIDVDSVTEVVGIGSGLADLMPDNVSPDDFFSSADSDDLWSWFSDETAASIDQTATSYSQSGASYDDYYHPFGESKYNLGSFLASLGGD